jgi:hypothetical protein
MLRVLQYGSRRGDALSDADLQVQFSEYVEH